MADPVESLIDDLLEWIGERPRPYAEVIEAWRTSCPRLPVWEEANARGYLDRVHQPGSATLVSVSAAGRMHLGAVLARRTGAVRTGPAHAPTADALPVASRTRPAKSTATA